MGHKQSRESAVIVQAAAGIRTAVVASAEPDRRSAIASELRHLRWNVREVAGGAQALSALEDDPAEVLILDDWLPDIQVGEVATLSRTLFPEMDQLRIDTGFDGSAPRSPRRNEILLALRAIPSSLIEPLPSSERIRVPARATPAEPSLWAIRDLDIAAVEDESQRHEPQSAEPRASVGPLGPAGSSGAAGPIGPVAPLPEMVGDAPGMRELAWLVRLVAPRNTTVLIEGETGTGKELVAKAVHRLSGRAAKPFVVLNCAAIPEALLEAELFGHTRGAFTGAVQSRTGRVEAAHGGTLFLDEIGEMPLALQAKLLRFLECGEIQRIGGNETMRVDVRIIAATHQPLKQRSAENAFRLDLYHRLAVFPVHVPSLAERRQDIPALSRYLLDRLGEEAPIKRLSRAAEERLLAYDWPGNVRELAHVLERATILSEDRHEIAAWEIRF